MADRTSKKQFIFYRLIFAGKIGCLHFLYGSESLEFLIAIYQYSIVKEFPVLFSDQFSGWLTSLHADAICFLS